MKDYFPASVGTPFATNFNKDILIFVFGGLQPIEKNGLNITDINITSVRSNTRLIVEATLHTPHPTDRQRLNPRSPLVVVHLPKSQLKKYRIEGYNLLIKKMTYYYVDPEK